MKKNKIILQLIFCFIANGCGFNNLEDNVCKKFVPIIDTNYCDSTNMYMFREFLFARFPLKNPNSIQESITLLDEGADANFKNTVINAPPGYLHFNLGLTIRNRWIFHGSDNLHYQLFNKLKLKNPDNCSMLIIGVYRLYLIDSLDVLSKIHIPDSVNNYSIVHTELLQIQKDLMQIKQDPNSP